MKVKKEYGKITGRCSVCTINCWDKTEGKPAIFPCGITDCPYETKKFQKNLTKAVDSFNLKGVM
tara:strand:- start:2378 stop:2569 length:192 start_codon:yes stop_codon:yes gene_type:complete